MGKIITCNYVTEYGEKPATITWDNEKPISAAFIPTLEDEHHVFVGWFLSSTYARDSKVKKGETLLDHNITSNSTNLYAYWLDKEYLIKGQTLLNLSNEIQDLVGFSDILTPSEMQETLDNIPRQYETKYIPITEDFIATPEGTYTKGDIIISAVPYQEVETLKGYEVVIGLREDFE